MTKIAFAKSKKHRLSVTCVRVCDILVLPLLLNQSAIISGHIYLFHFSDLEGLARSKRRSPYPEQEDIVVYLKRDIEKK